MFRQTVVIVVATVLCGGVCVPLVAGGSLLTPRIIGGTAAVNVSLPWMASISNVGEHICGGSIINKRTILTAAHCVKLADPLKLKVRVGSKVKSLGGELFAVESFKFHEKFGAANVETSDYDIGVVRLSRDIEFTDYIQPIELPRAGATLADNTAALVSGWGYQSLFGGETEYLQYTVISIINQETCKSLYKYGITDRMMCAGLLAGGRDACILDSGGPLVAGRKLVGIVSWGIWCGLPNKPGVYTRVSELVPWVANYLKQFGETL